MLRRFALKLKSWDVTILFWPGRLNANADGLSRQGEAEDEDVESSSDHVPSVRQLAFTDASFEGGDVGLPSSSS